MAGGKKPSGVSPEAKKVRFKVRFIFINLSQQEVCLFFILYYFVNRNLNGQMPLMTLPRESHLLLAYIP